jgi:Predicted membrane protein
MKMKQITDSKTWHEKHQETLTLGQRLADGLTLRIGSWTFILLQSAFVVIWIALNLIAYIYHWDPYPFIFLNLLFSVEAAYAAPIIMMSQNRQEERDRYQATEDFKTNVTAKKEIEEMQLALTRMENEKIDEILNILRAQKKK